MCSGVESSEDLLEGFEGAGNKCSSRFWALEGTHGAHAVGGTYRR